MPDNDIEAILSVILDTDASYSTCNQAITALANRYQQYLEPWYLEHVREQEGTRTSGGIALHPQGAIDCLADVWRTVKYIRAIEAAVTRLQAAELDEPLNIVYAGCGPLAPLILPLATRWQQFDLSFTLLDIHALSLQQVENLIDCFSLDKSAFTLICADAAQVHLDQPIHLMITETMTAGLNQEAQVAITCHLSRQLHPQGIVLPEAVTLKAAFADPQTLFQPMDMANADQLADRRAQFQSLGQVFTLDKHTTYKSSILSETGEWYLQGEALTLPDIIETDQQLFITTEISLFENHRLQVYESGLTYPMLLALEEIRDGAHLAFHYQVSDTPGLGYQLIC